MVQQKMGTKTNPEKDSASARATRSRRGAAAAASPSKKRGRGRGKAPKVPEEEEEDPIEVEDVDEDREGDIEKDEMGGDDDDEKEDAGEEREGDVEEELPEKDLGDKNNDAEKGVEKEKTDSDVKETEGGHAGGGDDETATVRASQSQSTSASGNKKTSPDRVQAAKVHEDKEEPMEVEEAAEDTKVRVEKEELNETENLNSEAKEGELEKKDVMQEAVEDTKGKVEKEELSETENLNSKGKEGELEKKGVLQEDTDAEKNEQGSDAKAMEEDAKAMEEDAKVMEEDAKEMEEDAKEMEEDHLEGDDDDIDETENMVVLDEVGDIEEEEAEMTTESDDKPEALEKGDSSTKTAGDKKKKSSGDAVPELEAPSPPKVTSPVKVREISHPLKSRTLSGSDGTQAAEAESTQKVLAEAGSSCDGDKKALLESEMQITESDGEPCSGSEAKTEMVAVSESDEKIVSDKVSDEAPDEKTSTASEVVQEEEIPANEKSSVTKKKTKLTENKEKKGKDDKKNHKKRKHSSDTGDADSAATDNDANASQKKAPRTESKSGSQAKARKPLPELEKYWKSVREDPTDFTGWTYLLQYVDQENDVDAAREAYNSFLARYPCCYGYWKKFADYEKRNSTKKNCEEVFERGLAAIPLSVDLWIHYLNYVKTHHATKEDFIRSQFDRALETCGIEFRSDKLWELYIKWESECCKWQNVTSIYDKLLQVPTMLHNNHLDNFQDVVNKHAPKELLSVDEFLTLRKEVLTALKQKGGGEEEEDLPPGVDEPPPGVEEETTTRGSDEETVELRKRIIQARKKISEAAEPEINSRWNYEEGIKRPYFHVKPLERGQLKNWKEYLEFEIDKGNQDRILVLFERCLIACAMYEEFWLKYVKYLEGLKENKDQKIREIYSRACTIHLPKKTGIHLQWAAFEEKRGNFEKSSEILADLEQQSPDMLHLTCWRINLERRRGNLEKAADIYQNYISTAKNEKLATNMAVRYARFCCLVLKDTTKAAEVLNSTIEKDKDNPKLYMQLIGLGFHRTPVDEVSIVATFDRALGKAASPEQKLTFSQRKVEFLEDFGSDIQRLLDAQEEHMKLLRSVREERKRKVPEEESTTPTTSSKTGSEIKTIEGQGKKIKSVSDRGSSSSYSQPPPQQQPSQQTQHAQQPYSQYGQHYGQNDYSQHYPNWNYAQHSYSYGQQGWGGYRYGGYGNY